MSWFTDNILGIDPVPKPPPSAQELALARGAAKDFNTFIAKYVPASRQFRGLTKATAGQRARVGGKAAAAAASNLKGAGGNDPLQVARTLLARGSATGRGAAAGGETLTNRERQGLTALVAFGRGVKHDADFGTASAARDATQSAIQSAANSEAMKSAIRNAVVQVGAAAGTARYQKVQQDILDKAVSDLGPNASLADMVKARRAAPSPTFGQIFTGI